jgi:hypothetical protein
MVKTGFLKELEQKTTRTIVIRSILRWESAVIIALTLVLFFLVPEPLPFWQAWFWLVLGGVGFIALVWSSLRDPEFRAMAVSEMFRERFDPREIRDSELRQHVERALECRDLMDEALAERRVRVSAGTMADARQDVATWMENVFRLAGRLDVYKADATVHQEMQSAGLAVKKLKTRLALEDDETVRREISQTIAQRQIQRDDLRRLETVMERAEFQLESTIAGMGNLYTQITNLSARDVASGRVRTLRQEIAVQAQAVHDMVRAVDEVYQAWANPR